MATFAGRYTKCSPQVVMKYLFSLLLFPVFVFSQVSKKHLPALKFDDKIAVDGKLNEEVWSRYEMPVAGDFVMLEPGDGAPIPERFDTRVKIFYSDEAIYVGAMLYDSQPDSILTQYTQRDDFDQNNDWFMIAFNPYNDGLSDFNFVVTAAGVQADSRTTASGDDYSWNTVWESATRITDSGWTVEMRIPYMALRFPETQSSNWGLNMIRSIRRNRTSWSWNYINRASGYRWEYQAGLFSGIDEIDPPVRLSLMPYLSTYVDNYRGETNYDFNGGLDLKYGINESFTLDMTLIPDFGQVALDQQFVNFSPFENRFDENRQFFTEGTELFTIGDIFYSRRIGGVPKNISNTELNDSGAVDVQTEYTRLLNATKISGRTDGNLGIGFLNAITADSYTTYTDAEGVVQRQLIEPMTNYNMLVLDQRFNRNSSLSFVNTNVLRNGSAYDANVAGLLTSLNVFKGNYLIDASLKRSDKVFTDETLTGYETKLQFGDISGNWTWQVKEDVKTDTYDPNDLGFLTRNNLWQHYAELQYRRLKPHGILNRSSYTFYAQHQSLFEPRSFEYFYVGFKPFWLDRNFNGFGATLTYSPVNAYDFYEPRTPGYFFKIDQQYSASAFVSTDYRKTLALDADVFYEHWVNYGRDQYTLNLNPRLRLGDHFFSVFSSSWSHTSNDYGYARRAANKVYFGRRNLYEISNAIDARYVFDNNKTLSLVARHLWTGLYYKQMYGLGRDGRLDPADVEMQDDLNFNTVNVDLRFSWWFAPGSELVLLYRNVIAATGSYYEAQYLNNFKNAVDSPAQNMLSLKLTYFLDYNQVKNHWF